MQFEGRRLCLCKYVVTMATTRPVSRWQPITEVPCCVFVNEEEWFWETARQR